MKEFYDVNGNKISSTNGLLKNVLLKIEVSGNKGITINGRSVKSAKGLDKPPTIGEFDTSNAKTYTTTSTLEEVYVIPHSSDGGTINIGNVTDPNSTFKITEIIAPDGYRKSNEEIICTLKPNEDGDWKLYCNGSSVADADKKIEFKNYANREKELVIQKVDEKGRAIAGIEFDLDLDLVRVCKIGDNVYFDGKKEDWIKEEKITIDGKEYKTWNSPGLSTYYLLDDNTSYSCIFDNDKDGTVKVTSTENYPIYTDENGEILITIMDYYPIGDTDLDGKVNSSDSRIIGNLAQGNNISGITINNNIYTLADINKDGLIVGEFTKDSTTTHGAYDIKNHKTVEYKNDMFIDGKFTLRDSAKLTITPYSEITVHANEKDSKIYKKKDTAETTTTLYYINNFIIIGKNSEVETKIKDYVVAISKLTEDEIKKGKDSELNKDFAKFAMDNTKIIMVIENEPKTKYDTFDLTLQKKDGEGNLIKEAGYEFAIEISDVSEFKIHKDCVGSGMSFENADNEGFCTVTGNTINCKTNNNGQILLKGIKTNSLNNIITIKETKTPDNSIWGKIIPTTIIRKIDGDGTVTFTCSNNEQVKVTTTGTDGTDIDISVEQPRKFGISLIKSDGYLSLNGALFNIKVVGVTENEKENVILENSYETKTEEVKSTLNGKEQIIKMPGLITLSYVSDSNEYKKFKVHMEEIKAPDGYKLPENPKVDFTVEQNSDEGWKVSTEESGMYSILVDENGSCIVTAINQREVNLNLTIEKRSSEEETIKGAQFSVAVKDLDTNKNIYENKNLSTDEKGNIVLPEIDFDKDSPKVEVTITETYTPEPYVLPSNPVTKFQVKYNSDNETWEKVSGYDQLKFNNNNVNVTIINTKGLPNINLYKVDSFDSYVDGAKFKFTLEGVKSATCNGKTNELSNGTLTFEGITGETIKESGLIYLTDIIPLETAINSDGSINYKITIHEISTKDGLKLLDKDIVLNYNFNIKTGKLTLNKDSSVIDTKEVTVNSTDNYIEITAIDRNVIEKLTLQKTDSVTGNTLPNAEFNLDFGGKVTELKLHKDCIVAGTYSGNPDSEGYIAVSTSNSSVKCKTNSDGKILLKDLVITEKNVTCTVTETKAPLGKDENNDGVIDYYYEKFDRAVSFDITYGAFGKTGNDALNVGDLTYGNGDEQIKVGSVTKNVSELAERTSTNYDITFSLKNVPLIDLSGQVWLDGQWGSKNVSSPDGNKGNGDEGVNDILVQLYKDEDTNTEINHTYTYTKDSANNGVMTNPRNGADLQGDHINDPTKEEEHFGDLASAGYYSFKGIEYRGKDKGYKIKFEYNGIEYQAVQNGVSKASELDRSGFNGKFTTINNNGANNSIKLEYAHSENGDIADLKGEIDGYNPATGNKDFTIYSQTNKYCTTTHNIDFGIKQRFFDLRLSNIEDSIKLTINDKETTYTFDEIERQEQNGNSQENPQLDFKIKNSDYNYRVEDYSDFPIENYDISTGETDDNDLTEIINNEKDKNKQLRAFITYEIKIIPQADEIDNKSHVNKISYEYDKHLEYMKIQKEDANGEFIDFNDNDFKLTNAKDGYFEITFNNEGLDVSGDGVILHITFEIKRDDEGGLPSEIKDGGLSFVTRAEILEYTTSQGLIDNDSCPGNNKEDDKDDGAGVKISLANSERTITGTVWDDDGNKDGKLDEGKEINDVIVQLIEIKSYNNDAFRREYIWQEMRTGSNKLKKAGSGGYEGEEDIDEELGAGEYKFAGFIPGNYIIRYIYGDGRTYDVTPNVEKYNGQDYQSAKDSEYHLVEWYNKANYEEKASIARDNEARRLTVMAFSTEIDGKLGLALSALNKDHNELTDNEKQQLTNYWSESFDGIDAYKYNIIEMSDEIKEEDFINSLSDLDEKHFKILKYYILQKTWMCAETSLINIPVDTEDKSIIESSTTVSFKIEDNSQILDNMNFGLKQRPQTKLELEKHITGLKITPTGTGVQPIVDAKINIEDVLNGDMNVTGIKKGLSTIKATRDERGYWRVETDIEELIQGAKLEVTYTYVIKNISDEDYLNENLVNMYKTEGIEGYINFLNSKSTELKTSTKGHTHTYGTFLGQYYYNQEKAASDAEVLSRVELIEECLNNNLDLAETTSDTGFEKINTANETKKVYDTNGNLDNIDIKTVIQNKKPTNYLKTGENDYNKNILLTATLSSSNKEISYPSHIAEIVKYSNAAGRRDVDSVPENLNYVHSNNTQFTLNTYYDKTTNKYYQERNGSIYENDIGTNNNFAVTNLSSIPETAIRLNEMDEFWGEIIMVTKPTGENKQEPVTIAIITISSIAVLGVGIVLIKKFVLKK